MGRLARLGLTEQQCKAKNRSLTATYGITLDEFTAILDAQGWQCPICTAPYVKGKLFCVDHEHRNGLEGPVRGILCFKCNRYKVGALKLSEANSILEYLTHPPAINVLGERIASPKKRKKYRRKRRPE